MPSISLEHVSLSYESNGRKIRVFSDMSLAFPTTGLISIIGESGSGKSTLLNLLAGYLSPTSGNIVRNCDLRQIAFVFQDLHLIDHLNVLDNVVLPLVIFGMGRKKAEEKGRKCLGLVGLSGYEGRMINQLSGGQRARVSLARGLVLDAPLILADEPTGSLDSANASQLMELFQKISKNRAVFIVTHNEKAAFQYSDEIYRIKDYRLFREKAGRSSLRTFPQPQQMDFGKIKAAENLRLAFSFLKKRLAKVSFSLIFTALCLALILVIFAFSKGGKEELLNLGKDYFDYTAVSMSEIREYEIPGQSMKLKKKVRLSEENEKSLTSRLSLSFFPALDFLLPVYTEASKGNKPLEKEIFFSPSFPETSRLQEGRNPSSYAEIVVNSSLLKLAQGKIGDSLQISHDSAVETSLGENKVSDIISLKLELKIVGVSKEKETLSRPTAYFDYLRMRDYLFALSLPKASSLYDTDLTLKERYQKLASEDDSLTYFKTLAEVLDPLSLKAEVKNNYPSVTLESAPLEMTSSFQDIISSFSKIIVLFIGLSLACSFFLEFTVIESLYKEKKEEMAVYLSFHISKREFFRLGRGQNQIFSAILSFLSFAFFAVFLWAGNRLLVYFGLSPFLKFNLFSLCLMLLASSLFAFLSGRLPLIPIYSHDLVMSLKGE